MPTIETPHRTSSSIVNMRSCIVFHLEMRATHEGSRIRLFLHRVSIVVFHEAPSATEVILGPRPADGRPIPVTVEIKFHFPFAIPVSGQGLLKCS